MITAISVVLLALSDPGAWSQTSQTIRIIVPFAPGGGADILGRLLAEEISRAQGVSALVENRPGAGTVIATEAVARAAPDGTTLLLNANSFVINPSLRKLTYDPLTGFEPVCYLAGIPMFVVVGRTSPYRTLGELLDAARARPGSLNLGSLGPATAQHIAFELLKRAAKVDMTFVPFSGNIPAINALMGGHLTSALGNYPEVREHVRSGNLRALATMSRTRVDLLPEVPTVAESGFRDYGAEVWLGLVAPAKTPPDRIAQLASWFTAAMQAPQVKPKLEVQGLVAKSMCGAEFGAYMRAQFDEYARAIRDANIKVD